MKRLACDIMAPQALLTYIYTVHSNPSSSKHFHLALLVNTYRFCPFKKQKRYFICTN